MKKITKFDIVLTILFIILISSLLIININASGKKSTLLITVEDKEYFYSINQKMTIELEGKNFITIVEIENGKFRFKESGCPEKHCTKMGWIHRSNIPVICLPNEISAYITNKNKEEEFDGISK